MSTEPSGTAAAKGGDSTTDGDLELRRYLEFLWKHKWTILAAMAVGIVVAVVYTKRQPKVYEATTSVVVNPQAPQVFGHEVQEVVQLGAGNYWSNQEYYNTQVEIIEARSLAEKTVRRFKLHEDSRLLPGADPTLTTDERINLAVDIVDGAIRGSSSKDSRIIRIHVQHTDPSLARDLANYHRQVYQGANIDVRTDKTDEASRFLAIERDSAEKKLRDAEDALSRFKQDNGLLSVSLEDKMNLIATDLQRYSAAHSDARIKRIELAALRKRAQASRTGDVLDSPIFALTDSPAVQALKDNYVREKQKFVEVQADFLPKSSRYLEQQKKVADLYADIEREANLALRQLEERYQAALAAETQFASEVERLTKEALDLGPKTVEHNRLQREAEAAAANFKVVQDRLQVSQISARNHLDNIEEHDAATLPTSPIRPRLMLNVGLAAVVFLFLGVGLAFGIEMLDRTVKTAEQVEAAIRAPLLGPIPLLKEVPSDPSRLSERDLYVFKHPTSRAAECCRSIRTNILFSGADRALRVLTVTSPNPREGKTTSVIYLGTIFAQSNQRVLLVDTDMRRPRLHKSLGVPRGRGLSNLLLGDTGYDDVVKTTDIPNLFVLPCGPTPPNPAELLLTRRFKQVLDDLRERYDLILLDSPPLQAVSDAVVLSRLSDGVIVVAEAGKTHREALVRASRQLRDVDAHVVGVILNDLDLTDRRYGYYAYYGYGEGSEPAAEN